MADADAPSPAGRWAALLTVFALNLLMHVPLLGTAPLAGTEAHRAVTAHQMVERGDPWVPMLYGRLYLRKPPLHYQVLALAEWVTGRADPWVWRMPSVLWAGLTAAVLVYVAWGWWGQIAGWSAGLLQTGMVALWAQTRSAEIDALNTLLAAAAALAAAACFRGALLAGRRDGRPASVAIGLLAVTLFLTFAAKGPAGLPAPLGVTLAAVALLPGAWKVWRVWAGWAGGALLVAAAGTLLAFELRRRGLPLDLSGVREGIDNLYDTRPARYAQALLLPIQLLVFSLPASAILLAGLWHWRLLSPTSRWLTVSVPAGWAVCVASGMVNPRYAYVTFPLAAFAAAGVVAELARTLPMQRYLRPAAGVGVAAIVLLAVPMAYLNHENRSQRSGYAAALELQSFLTRHGLQEQTVLVAQALRFQPELMFYSGMSARSPGENLPPRGELPDNALLLLTDEELLRLRAGGEVNVLLTVESNRRKLHLARLGAASDGLGG